jgi:hypothetical protein
VLESMMHRSVWVEIDALECIFCETWSICANNVYGMVDNRGCLESTN